MKRLILIIDTPTQCLIRTAALQRAGIAADDILTWAEPHQALTALQACTRTFGPLAPIVFASTDLDGFALVKALTQAKLIHRRMGSDLFMVAPQFRLREQVRCWCIGAHYITKPLFIDDLVACVRQRWLSPLTDSISSPIHGHDAR